MRNAKLWVFLLMAGFIGPQMQAQTGLHSQALPATPPVAINNPQTPAKIELGKMLYFDPRLSTTGAISCNSCHNVMAGGDDSRPVSVGVEGRLGSRSSPTVWNAAYLSVQFWDGRAESLEEQAKGPIVNPVEMGFVSHSPAVARIAALPGYQKLFKEVFGGENSVTLTNIVRAIASYERVLVTPGNAYDRYVDGDKLALSEQAQRGLHAVESNGCTGCHSGPLFAGPSLPQGVGFYQKFPLFAGSDYEAKYRLAEDLGRFQVTNNEADKNLFRVPTWRNIALTAPYFHNGSVSTLEEAVRVMAKTQLNKVLPDDEVSDMVAFLTALSGPFPVQVMPRLPDLNGSTFIK